MKTKYSTNEQRLLDLIPRNGGQVSTLDLVNSFYKDKEVPLNSRLIIGAMMRTLMKKSKFHKERWHIFKTSRRGPKPISYWIGKAG